MRVYLPATLPMLRQALADERIRPVAGTGFAVTEALEGEYRAADRAELEYLAIHDAALASLRLIAGTGAEPVRVVVAAEIAGGGPGSGDRRTSGPDGDAFAEQATVTDRADLDRAAVRVTGTVPWSAVASIHMDGGDAAAVVAEAARVIDDADMGQADAEIIVGNAEDVDLAWYAPAEVAYLVAELDV